MNIRSAVGIIRKFINDPTQLTLSDMIEETKTDWGADECIFHDMYEDTEVVNCNNCPFDFVPNDRHECMLQFYSMGEIDKEDIAPFVVKAIELLGDIKVFKAERRKI